MRQGTQPNHILTQNAAAPGSSRLEEEPRPTPATTRTNPVDRNLCYSAAADQRNHKNRERANCAITPMRYSEASYTVRTRRESPRQIRGAALRFHEQTPMPTRCLSWRKRWSSNALSFSISVFSAASWMRHRCMRYCRHWTGRRSKIFKVRKLRKCSKCVK